MSQNVRYFVRTSTHDSLGRGDTYMRRWIMSPLVQIMASRLNGARQLSEPMLAYCQLDPWEETQMKL